MIFQRLFNPFDRLMASQWACPHGPLGWLAGKLMERGNAAMNDLGLEALDPQPRDDVLELGFGPGVALERLIAVVTDGLIAGVDPSSTMIQQATARLKPSLGDGRVQLRRGTSSAIPYPGASFDRVLSVNTIYFWADPSFDLREIRRVLRPGGRLVVVLRATTEGDGVPEVHGMRRRTSVEDVVDWMEQVGFGQVTRQTREVPFGPMTVVGVAIIGTAG